MTLTDDEEKHPASIVVQRRIEWPDTDASGVYYYGVAFRLFDAAEMALLFRLGLIDVLGRLPRVRTAAEFLELLSLRDLVDVSVRVAKVGQSSVQYAFEVRRAGAVCVRGETVVVLLDRPGGAPVQWPASARALLLGAGSQTPETFDASTGG